MSQSCRASYKFTKDELVASMTAHYGGGIRTGIRLFATFFFSLFLILAIIGSLIIAFDERDDGPRVLISFVCAALFSIFFIVFINCRRWWWLRGFSSRPGADGTIEWEFEDSVIRTTSELGESSSLWQSFHRIVKTDKGFLFYVLKNVFVWIPFSAFESQECIEHVRSFATKNNVRFIERKSF